MKRLITTLILVGLSVSCSGKKSTPGYEPNVSQIQEWPPGATSFNVLGHTIYVSSATASNPIKLEQVLDSVSFTINYWQNYNCTFIPPTKIGVVDYRPFTCANEIADAVGCWEGGDVVTVWVGDNNELPFLFHEFCHRVYHLYDHTDPRWIGWVTYNSNCATEIVTIRQSKSQ